MREVYVPTRLLYLVVLMAPLKAATLVTVTVARLLLHLNIVRVVTCWRT